MAPIDNAQKISRLDGVDFDELEGLKKKRHKIRGDQGRPATNPSMVKLVSFLRKQGISNL